MRIAWPVILVCAACGGGGSALEGMYMIDAWNRNTTGCADPGPSVIESESAVVFYIKKESFFGADFLNVKDCPDLAECEEQAADDDTIYLGIEFGTYEEGNDDDGWTSTSAFAFVSFDDPARCDGDVTVATLTADGDAGATVRKETTEVSFPAQTGEEECPDDAALAAASGQPCTQLELAHGTQIGDI